MPLFDMAIQEYGKDIFAFYYDLPFEETLRRHAAKPNRADFGEEDMRRWWNEKDFNNKNICSFTFEFPHFFT